MHLCDRDPNTWDRYSQHRNRDETVREQAVNLMASGVKAGQAAAFLNIQHHGRIQPKDIHRLTQTNRENMRSLSDAGVTPNQSQQLLEAIRNHGDHYRVKFRNNTQIMDCIFYWDPADVQLARRFSQVSYFVI